MEYIKENFFAFFAIFARGPSSFLIGALGRLSSLCAFVPLCLCASVPLCHLALARSDST